MASSMQRLLGKSTGRLGAVFYEVLPCLSVLRCWSVKSVRSVKLANWFGHVPASNSPCQSSHPLSVAWTELLKRSWIRNTHRDTSWHRDLIIVHTTKKHKETKLQTDQSCAFLGTPCLSPQSVPTVPICPMWPMCESLECPCWHQDAWNLAWSSCFLSHHSFTGSGKIGKDPTVLRISQKKQLKQIEYKMLPDFGRRFEPVAPGISPSTVRNSDKC